MIHVPLRDTVADTGSMVTFLANNEFATTAAGACSANCTTTAFQGGAGGGTAKAPPSPSKTGGAATEANVGADISTLHTSEVHAQCQNVGSVDDADEGWGWKWGQ